jgi:hypothetical protein
MPVQLKTARHVAPFCALVPEIWQPLNNSFVSPPSRILDPSPNANALVGCMFRLAVMWSPVTREKQGFRWPGTHVEVCHGQILSSDFSLSFYAPPPANSVDTRCLSQQQRPPTSFQVPPPVPSLVQRRLPFSAMTCDLPELHQLLRAGEISPSSACSQYPHCSKSDDCPSP